MNDEQANEFRRLLHRDPPTTKEISPETLAEKAVKLAVEVRGKELRRLVESLASEAGYPRMEAADLLKDVDTMPDELHVINPSEFGDKALELANGRHDDLRRLVTLLAINADYPKPEVVDWYSDAELLSRGRGSICP